MISRQFLFCHGFNSFSMTQQKDGRYQFEVSLCYSNAVSKRYWKERRDSCFCDEDTLYRAVDLIKAHNLADKSLFPASISWDDTAHPDLYLQLEYCVGGEQFSLFSDDGMAAPYVDSNHQQYSEVLGASYDLLLLFLSCKDNEKAQYGKAFKGPLERYFK